MNNIQAPAIADHARRFADSENGRYAHRLPIFFEGRDSGEGATTRAFYFAVEHSRRGAALQSLTWVLAGLESHCAPVEEVQITYGSAGGVRAEVYVAAGWLLPEGMHDFLALSVTSPRVASMGWALDTLPRYSTIAATAVSNPARFEEIGAQLKAVLDAKKATFLPDMLCPCASPTAQQQAQAAARAPGVLKDLREGWGRVAAWLGKGGEK